MNDVFDEIERVGRSGSRGMGKRLRSESVKDALVAASRKGRRRYAVTQGAVALGAVGLLALGVATLPTFRGETPVNPGVVDLSGAVVGPIDPYPQNFWIPWCAFMDQPGAGVYVPFGEPGVTIADPSVADLNIRVEATLTQTTSPEGTTTAVGPGGSVDFTATDDAGGTSPGVQFRVTWDGDVPLTVDAVAFLVTDGWNVTIPWADNVDRLAGVEGQTTRVLPEYDPATGRSLKAAFTSLAPMCQTDFGVADGATRVPEGGTSEIHTVVQVKDANGTAIAMFVDATGIESTGVTFSGYVAEGATVALPPITDEDRADALALHQQAIASYVPELSIPGSAGVRIAAMIDAEGTSLEEANMGYRPFAACDTQLDEWAASGYDLGVVPSPLAQDDPQSPGSTTAGVLRIPRTWSLADIYTEYGGVPFSEGSERGYTGGEWFIGYGMTLIFTEVGDPSLVRGVITGFPAWQDPSWTPENPGPNPDFVESPETAILSFVQGGPCDDFSGITPGDYQVVIVVGGAPLQFRTSLGTQQAVAETWIDYGIVTITE